MSQYGFFIDVAKCTGCKTCILACKDAHSLPVGINFRKVHEYVNGGWKKNPDGTFNQDVCGYYVSIACNECEDPACVNVCPTKAHTKRAEDGLVLIDIDKCIGCGACVVACPYEVPVLDTAAKKTLKCDACIGRLQVGLLPICVEACPQRAIEFGLIEDLRKAHGDNASIAPLPPPSTKPSLVVGKPKHGWQPSVSKS